MLNARRSVWLALASPWTNLRSALTDPVSKPAATVSLWAQRRTHWNSVWLFYGRRCCGSRAGRNGGRARPAKARLVRCSPPKALNAMKMACALMPSAAMLDVPGAFRRLAASPIAHRCTSPRPWTLERSMGHACAPALAPVGSSASKQHVFAGAVEAVDPLLLWFHQVPGEASSSRFARVRAVQVSPSKAAKRTGWT